MARSDRNGQREFRGPSFRLKPNSRKRNQPAYQNLEKEGLVECELALFASRSVAERTVTTSRTNALLQHRRLFNVVHPHLASQQGTAPPCAATMTLTWFDTYDVAHRVAERIGRLEVQYNPGTAIQNARELTSFLQRMETAEAAVAKMILEHSTFEQLTDLSQAEDGIVRLEKTLITGPWSDVSARYKSGAVVSGTIVNVREFGVFVELEPGVTGLVHQSKLPTAFLSMEELAIGERVDVEILTIDAIRRRIDMNYRGTTPGLSGLLN
jgi:hypothetical protein